ncbi:tetratricopeptide repeat protein, partial [Gammaproteobacteria bacterium]|nr:tetratricopeptide repeat protein [Gammaproteobacteria bacterium]
KVLENAKKQGVAREKVEPIEEQLALIVQAPESILSQQKKSLAFSERRKKLAKQKKRKKRAIEQNVKGVSPPQEQLISLLEHFQNRRFGDAETLSVSITQEFPMHQFGWKVLGSVLQQTGRAIDSLAAMQKSVQLAPRDAEAHNNMGNTLKDLRRLDEAEASYTQAIALDPDYAEAHSNLGNTLQELRRLHEAEASYALAIALKPEFAEAYSNLGIVLKELGRLDEAEAGFMQAIALKPGYVEAHNNLGVTLRELGRLDEAEASYTQAIALKPGYVQAHNNLGVTLRELGRLDEAEASYTQAIALKPDYAEAHSNLGYTLQELGRVDEACSAYIEAINLNPDLTDIYVNLGTAIKNVRFNSSNRNLYPPLAQLLSAGNYARPADLAPSILSLLKHDPLIKDLLLEKNFATNLAGATSIIGSLDKLMLLHSLMRLCPLPDLQFEKFFVTMRSLLLKNLDKMEASPELIYFLSTLSIHCFTNEYIYIESDEETHLIGELQTKILQTVAKSEQPEPTEILCLATYRKLHYYDWCQKLDALDNLEEVKSRLIEEPYAESAVVAEIPVLGEITDDVSCKVRVQYEENPYPRWVKIGIPTKAKSISEICAEVNLHLHSESIKNVIAPEILIAGCGTGQHSIGAATRFSDCQVTAVDLSLASLAYGKRKTAELGITNLEYLQADILKLNNLGRDFDVIESAGVLHHMDEPMVGWRGLTDLLKPGGLMKIGLYSELARHHIVVIRKEIAEMKVGTSKADIRGFRQLLAESHDENHHLLTKSSDFFSLSMLRDLIFHVQEHRFTLLQIKNWLDELGLKFCGFENKIAISNFREFHGKEADIYDLMLWHQYEERHPRAFAGMYQFWCQKP